MWHVVSRHDLSFKAAGFASCILLDERMQLDDAATPSALEVFRAVNGGDRIDFRTKDENHIMWCRNPVLGAVRTFGDAVRIVFEDDRAVELTTGHVLPMTEDVSHEYAQESWIVLAGMVRPGMRLLDGTVKRVDPLGRRHAVRMWTHHPAWLTMANGLRVGSRWHEIMEAWLSCHDQEEEIEHGSTTVGVWDRVYGMPVSSGWRDHSNEPLPATWWQQWRGRWINRATLGRVDHVLWTLRERGDMRATLHGPSHDRQFWFRQNRLEFGTELWPTPKTGLGKWADDPRLAGMTLPVPSTVPKLHRHKWSDLRSLLTSGPDVVTDVAA